MIPDSINIVFPETVEEAVERLEAEPGAMTFAGGTDLVPKLKRRQFRPTVLVSLEHLEELRGIRRSSEGVHIGARTTIRELQNCAEFVDDSAIVRGAKLVASPAIRNRGTVGGNLLQDTRCQKYDRSELWREGLGWCMKCEGEICRVAPGSDKCLAACCSDLAPAFIVHDARVKLVGGQTRILPLHALYQSDGADHLEIERGELLTEVIVPDGEVRSSYDKLRVRGGIDFPELGVAVALEEAGGQRFRIRVALSGIQADVPLWEEEVDPDEIDDFVDEVYRGARPMDNAHFPPLYRKRCIRPYVQRQLEELR